MENYLPLLIYFVAVVGFAAGALVVPHLIAPRRPTPVKNMPYESGMDPVGDARQPLHVRFYLIAILFLVFDVELLFLYPWAVSFRAEGGVPEELRGAVMVVMLTLLATLGLAYLVARRKGVFEWRER